MISIRILRVFIPVMLRKRTVLAVENLALPQQPAVATGRAATGS